MCRITFSVHRGVFFCPCHRHSVARWVAPAGLGGIPSCYARVDAMNVELQNRVRAFVGADKRRRDHEEEVKKVKQAADACKKALARLKGELARLKGQL